MAKASLLARVQAGIVRSRPGIQPWHTRLPKDVQRELAAVKAWYRESGDGTQLRSVARSVVEQLQIQRVKCPSIQTVETWLRSDD